MSNNLKCFISAPHELDTSVIKNALATGGVDSYDLYDFSIGDSIQQILKRKLRQVDFALFILAGNSTNMLYEMGVCEGLGKQYFVLIEKGYKVPFYIPNRLFINEDLDDYSFLKVSIDMILQDVKKGKKNNAKELNKSIKPIKPYSSIIQSKLVDYHNEAVLLRHDGKHEDVEKLMSKVFSAIGLNFVENTVAPDRGIDFVLWNDNLAKVISSQILIEVKSGNLNKSRIKNGIEQIKSYALNTDVGAGILLYFDRNGRRFEMENSFVPLIIHYDLEDFIESLISKPIERIILENRNAIAHKAV